MTEQMYLDQINKKLQDGTKKYHVSLVDTAGNPRQRWLWQTRQNAIILIMRYKAYRPVVEEATLVVV